MQKTISPSFLCFDLAFQAGAERASGPELRFSESWFSFFFSP
jgi:hypothetical protein